MKPSTGSTRPMFKAAHAGDVRIGPVSALPAVLQDLGVSPRRVFDRAGVKLDSFRNHDFRLPFEALGCLFSESEALTNCYHLGLLVGERFALSDLGAIGTLMQNSSTVGAALQELLLHLHLHDRGAVPVLLRLEQSSMLLGYSIYKNSIPAMAQLYDASIAIAYRLLRQICGPGWKPLRVQFSHSQPNDVHPYHRIFGAKPLFDAEVSGIAFASSWLDHAIAGADPSLRDAVQNSIKQYETDKGFSFTEEVQSVLHQAIMGGVSSSRSVAILFGIHERTLRKRLSAEGTSLRKLVSQSRYELAKQLLQNTRLPVTEVAAALNYSDSNVFSRAFHTWAGVSPRQWRAGRLT